MAEREEEIILVIFCLYGGLFDVSFLEHVLGQHWICQNVVLELGIFPLLSYILGCGVFHNGCGGSSRSETYIRILSKKMYGIPL